MAIYICDGKKYNTDYIVIMKSGNFYVLDRTTFRRDMTTCIAMYCLPFDYDPDAKCPEIDKAFKTQWGNDEESIDLLLQFLYYSMTPGHKYKAILCMIGESDSGKTQILELVRHFIGYNGCEALSLGKIGNRFELYRARYSNLLICDDLYITAQDLKNGAIIENLKSIPSGVPIRIEKKGGDIKSRSLPCQIIMAGNEPPKIPQLSNALANRLYFLNFPHVFKKGKDMDVGILDIWLKELPGLMNRVLDAGEKLEKQRGFIEPASSLDIRSRFEGGSNPVKKWVKNNFNVNATNDKIKWHTRAGYMREYYKEFKDDTGLEFPLSAFYAALESIEGVKKDCSININVPDGNGKFKQKKIKCWEGIRKKGTSGIVTENDSPKGAEF